MNNKLRIVAIVLLNIVFVFHLTAQDNSWILEKNIDNIKVYTRSVTNAKNKEFKAITYSNKSMEYFEDLIWDADNYKAWQEKVSFSEVINVISEDEMYVYYITDLPWPLTDRDIVYHIKKTISPKGVIRYDFTCTPKYIKEKTNYLRLQDSKGEWIFTPMLNGQVEIIYHFHGDPAGNIPTWVVNMFLVKGPFNTLQRIK